MTKAELKTLAEETAYELCEGPLHADQYDAACAYCCLNYRFIFAALQRVQRAQMEADVALALAEQVEVAHVCDGTYNNGCQDVAAAIRAAIRAAAHPGVEEAPRDGE